MYNPSVSHYRREHAPLRRYLPSEVNIRSMFKDFREKNPHFKCGYELYRSEVRKMRISFAKLGEEGCKICEEFHTNKNSHDHPVDLDALQEVSGENDIACTKCSDWIKHIKGAKTSRTHYQTDKAIDSATTIVRSVDLQKVIMLPRLPGNKTAVFTKRIIAFHETFAPVGKRATKTNKRNTISVLWHEGIAGRKQEEITSTFAKALEKDRDSEHIIYWLDNCAAQNKNWCLLSTLVNLVNSDKITCDDITLKYFERGHTFMSADSFHHGVEKEISKQPGGNLYDFPDFVRVVSQSNSGHVDVVELAPDDVRAWVGGQSIHALNTAANRPLISKIVQVQFRRGSRSMFYKYDHDDVEFITFNFLKRNHRFGIPGPLRDGLRGVPLQRKTDIVAKLCPMMPLNRRDFWLNMPVSEEDDFS